ncbi:MAG: hypothetical protein ABSD64_07380 [Terriglobales bacterium]
MFDTSAHNRLADDPHSESILTELKSMWFRFAGLSIEELFAAPLPRRDDLFTSCRQIHRGPSECFLPNNLLTEQLILAHFNDPATFNWKTVDVRWPDCDREIRNPKFFDDDPVSKEQREFLWERRQSDKQRFVSLRPKLKTIFEEHGETPPTTFRGAISILDNVGNSAMWYKAQFYYDLVTTMDSGEATVKEFAAACPPFLSLIYAVFLPWYNNAVRDPNTGEKMIAGSNDLYMSVYLPYVDLFVTDDTNQEKALREVASFAKLETKILSYDDFCTTLTVSV